MIASSAEPHRDQDPATRQGKLIWLRGGRTWETLTRPEWTVRKYGVAALATALAFMLSRLLGPELFPHLFQLFLAAVLLSALYGGLGPALMASLTSTGALVYLLLEGPGLQAAGPREWIGLVTFVLLALLVGSLTAMLRRAQQQADAARLQAQAAVRMRDDFVSLVTHELNTPLTVIKAYAQMLERQGCTTPHAVETILAQTDRLERLVSDLLDATRVEAGRLQLRPTQVDLVRLARACAEQAQCTNTTHRVRVQGPAEPIWGCWDPDRIAQVLQNLLSNALKYSPAGGEVLLDISAADGEARLAVHDQGIGIARDAQARLFERFYRVDLATAVSGLGLGLYITRELVEAHGGRLWVDSAPGCGSSFTVALPCDPDSISRPRTTRNVVSGVSGRPIPSGSA